MAIYKKIDVQGDVHPILWKCLGYIWADLANHGVKTIHITSIREGIHALTSMHYLGLALDWKQAGIDNEVNIIKGAIKRFCNKYGKSVNDFDLITYTDGKNIHHLEYDIKNL